jgi:hypothetical protein
MPSRSWCPRIVALAAVCLAAALLVCLSATTAAAADDVARPPPLDNANGANTAGVVGLRKRSIFQACRSDITKLCMGGAGGKDGGKDAAAAAAERRMSLRNAATCLESKESEVEDAGCKAWLGARRRCFADAEKDGVCPGLASPAPGDAKESDSDKRAALQRGRVMTCLRTVASEALSRECTQSDFYRAIAGLRRFHNRFPADAKRKLAAKRKASE